MNTSFSRKQLGLAVACALALGFASSAARAQHNMGPNDSRELWTATPNQVWKNGFGECWHSAFGPPPGNNECNPAPIAQAAPAPYVAPMVVAAVPAQPVYEQVTLEANVLFDFDKSVLRPEGRKTLDAFAENLKSINSAEIAAVGFADRFGTDGYNQALSERRVATVKAYLVAKGIEPRWGVHSTAKGESQPTTAAGECNGATPNASTIACLQPDRHVSVEISGSKIKQ
jgi:OOP family OmpA-OmpF porin